MYSEGACPAGRVPIGVFMAFTAPLTSPKLTVRIVM